MSGASSVLALPRVIGHRGAMAYAPENTEASFRAAKARGLNVLSRYTELRRGD